MVHSFICRALAASILSTILVGCSSKTPAEGETAAADRSGAAAGGQVAAKPQTDPLHPIVKIETNQGEIVVKLDAEKAPITVNNFLHYVNTAFYDNTLFHYVAPGSMIMGGGFTPELAPKPQGIPIRNEAHNGLANQRGTIAMSRQPNDIDSATSQFFINLGNNGTLDHKTSTPDEYGYCVFGEVTTGLEIAEKIASQPTIDQGDFVQTPQERVVIKSIRVIR